jgi:cytoskeletal protein RodZ
MGAVFANMAAKGHQLSNPGNQFGAVQKTATQIGRTNQTTGSNQYAKKFKISHLRTDVGAPAEAAKATSCAPQTEAAEAQTATARATGTGRKAMVMSQAAALLVFVFLARHTRYGARGPLSAAFGLGTRQRFLRRRGHQRLFL